MALPRDVKFENAVKYGVFAYNQQGNKLIRANFDNKCTLSACFRVQNFAMIGKWGLVYEPPQTLKIVQIYVVTHGYVS